MDRERNYSGPPQSCATYNNNDNKTNTTNTTNAHPYRDQLSAARNPT